MVPDFRIQLPSSTTGFGLAPGELKYTCSELHYRTGVRQREFQRAVERRAGQLMNEYRAKAERMDELLGQDGRIRQQLDQYGDLITIVVGKYNELSEGGHKILEAVAESKVAIAMYIAYIIDSIYNRWRLDGQEKQWWSDRWRRG